MNIQTTDKESIISMLHDNLHMNLQLYSSDIDNLLYACLSE